jgi:hypothetical protein
LWQQKKRWKSMLEVLYSFHTCANATPPNMFQSHCLYHCDTLPKRAFHPTILHQLLCR